MNEIDPKIKSWIDNASYETLLCKNRFGSMDDSMFIGVTGKYFMATMAKRKQELSDDEAVYASKSVGWER